MVARDHAIVVALPNPRLQQRPDERVVEGDLPVVGTAGKRSRNGDGGA